MKIWKTIFTIAKTLIIIVSISHIVWKVYKEVQSGVLFNELYDLNIGDLFTVLVVFVLVLANWFFESIKFIYLVKPIQKITIKQSIKGVLAGIAVSIFTPKRVGDFGGRIFVLESKNRVTGIFATLLGSLSQLLVTLIIGIALFPFYFKTADFIRENVSNISLFFFIVFVIIIGLLIVYFNISKVADVLCKFKFFKKHIEFITFLKKYKNWELGRVLLISFLRYAVFTLQYFLLLQIFGANISYFSAIIGIRDRKSVV